MILLALDTTGRRGSLALSRHGEILANIEIEAPEGFGQSIYQEIDNLLARHQIRLPDIDVYAAAAGPGSFTGIRVGLTAAKALAEVYGKRVVPVSNLLALAYAGVGRYRAPVMDARRGEVFAAVYDENLRSAVEEAATTWTRFVTLVEDRAVTFVSNAPGLFEASGVAPIDADSHPRWKTLIISPALATPVAQVAFLRAKEGAALPPEAVDANYVRRSDAELNWQEPI